MKIGVLTVQGATDPHFKRLEELGMETVGVKTPEALHQVAGLILPGGESTAMIHLLKQNGLWESLKTFSASRPCWGICAGAILLANKVSNPKQDSLKAVDIEIERNAFGRQIDSFIAQVEPTAHWTDGQTVEAVFIRAPRIRKVGPTTAILFNYQDEAVCVEQGSHLISTFHPELTRSSLLHQYFIEKCKKEIVPHG